MTPETEALCKRLETVESDPIGAGLSNNRYRNPDGPEAAAKLREMAGALEYYADPARWQTTSAGITPAMDDRGHRVRAALQEAGE